jgi:hypothetical protein
MCNSCGSGRFSKALCGLSLSDSLKLVFSGTGIVQLRFESKGRCMVFVWPPTHALYNSSRRAGHLKIGGGFTEAHGQARKKVRDEVICRQMTTNGLARLLIELLRAVRWHKGDAFYLNVCQQQESTHLGCRWTYAISVMHRRQVVPSVLLQRAVMR